MPPELHVSSSAEPPAIRFSRVGKAFGPTTVLADIDLSIDRGTVHAFVGQNGAGKSTTLGILTGRLSPSQGHVEVFGQALSPGEPRAARAAGIAAIYQELTIVPTLSAADNVFLGQPLVRHGIMSDSAMRARFRELAGRFDACIAPETQAGRLSIADHQILEILRALQAEARIILLDEPTAALPPFERDTLFRRLKELRASGVTMVLVSHNLDEVLDLADAISVFRNGRLVRTAKRGEWTKPALVRAMLGHAPASAPRRKGRPFSLRLFLEASGITVPGLIEDAAITVGEGEIVGLAGLVGSGRTTLLRALAGLEPRAAGRLVIEGKEYALPRNPNKALALGIALVPEDRKGQGLALSMSARENILLSDFGSVATAGVLSERRMTARAGSLVSAFGFDPARLMKPARTLSGGSQQKLLLARWNHRRPRLLLADEPTRGIDIGAKEEILATFRRLAEEGLSIVIVSSDLEEVAGVADRILVLSAGRSVGWLNGGASVSEMLHKAFATEPDHD
ncbi:sugar ABC transporter ATP-binding protein [Inquilinus limosus]|uniref:sugar ABC transporter ATP-binding protein n=1 Tax=Inquilinus limosus TaxID=171674 RepID=UPI003F15CB8A